MGVETQSIRAGPKSNRAPSARLGLTRVGVAGQAKRGRASQRTTRAGEECAPREFIRLIGLVYGHTTSPSAALTPSSGDRPTTKKAQADPSPERKIICLRLGFPVLLAACQNRPGMTCDAMLYVLVSRYSTALWLSCQIYVIANGEVTLWKGNRHVSTTLAAPLNGRASHPDRKDGGKRSSNAARRAGQRDRSCAPQPSASCRWRRRCR